MVIRGNARSNPRQLAHYLLAKKDNETIRILDVDGFDNAKPEDLHRAVFAMGISAELSKSEKGLYHAQINPAIGEDKKMSDEHWLEAGDILGRQLGLDGQRRAIVLHSKKGRTHAHVVWERYDHEKEKMVSDSFSRLAQDRARKEMELTFGHNQTPHRNKHRPELKASLTQLWNQTNTGAQFVKAARNNEYIIAEGSGRNPYVVVDENGRSFNLARQIQGVRLKEVRQRLRHESLMGEKDAIIVARNAASADQREGKGAGEQQLSSIAKPHPMSKQFADNGKDVTGQSNAQSKPGAEASVKKQFSQNKSDTTKAKEPAPAKAESKKEFAANKPGITGQQPQKTVQEKFAENKGAAEKEQSGTGKEDKRREEFRKRMEAMKEKASKSKDKDKGLDMG